MTWQELKDQAQFCFTQWPQGRPLNHLLPHVLTFAGARLGGVQAMYAVGALWLALNGWLVYRLARRWFSAPAAMVAAFAYILYPPDTTRQLLIHIAHVQGAMTFLLLSLLLYTRQGFSRWLAYPVSALCLLSYETSFLPFLAAPIFPTCTAKTRWWRPWLIHALGCGIILGSIALIRMSGGESRVAEAAGNLGEAAWKSFSSLGLGPWTGLRGHLLGLAEGATSLNFTSLVSAFVLLGLLWSWLALAKPSRKAEKGESPPQTALLALALAAAATWALSYALTLINYPPTQLSGRATSTHVAAAWPVAVLIGCLAEAVFRMRTRLRSVSIVLLALCFGLLNAKGLRVQQEYALSWRLQKDFWLQVLTLAPDAEPGCAILVAGSIAPGQAASICSNSWADYHACRALYGGGRAEEPIVSFGHHGILLNKLSLHPVQGALEWTPAFWDPKPETVPADRLILLESAGGKLTRVQRLRIETLQIESTRPIPAADPKAAPRSRLFRDLLRNSETESPDPTSIATNSP